MVPPGIGPGSCPRQGHVLAIGLWDLCIFFVISKIFKCAFFLLGMAKGGGLFFFILYLVLGAYFLNFGLNFIKLPEVATNINRWIIFAGGVLLIFGGINYLRANRYNRVR